MTVTLPSSPLKSGPAAARDADDLGGLNIKPPLGAVATGLALGAATYALLAGPYYLHLLIVGDQEPTAVGVAQLFWLFRVFSSPVNLLSLLAFGVAMLVLVDRRRQLREQEKGFGLNLIAADEDTLILPEDALEIRKRTRVLPPRDAALLPVHLLRAGLQRARANWSAEDVGQAVRAQAELLSQQLESAYSLVKYLAWAIPSIGFIGTVMGVGNAMYAFGDDKVELAQKTRVATSHLYTAFDTTLVALVLSLVLMYVLHGVQAQEESFLVRATNWCMHRFVYRMHVRKEG